MECNWTAVSKQYKLPIKLKNGSTSIQIPTVVIPVVDGGLMTRASNPATYREKNSISKLNGKNIGIGVLVKSYKRNTPVNTNENGDIIAIPDIHRIRRRITGM